MPPGGSKRGVCPFCFASHEQSFVVRMDAQDHWKLWYQCYRAACGAHGLYSDSGGLTLSTTKALPEVKTDSYADHPPITPYASERLAKYQVSHSALVREGVRYDSDYEEALFPINNLYAGARKHVGWQVRKLDRKAIRTNFFHDPHYQYTVVNPVGAMNGPILVVENPLSAIRLAEATHWERCAIALLGHELSSATALQLQAWWRDYTLLLDPDTWPGPTTKVLRTLEGAGCSAIARYISKKPYALSDEEIREIVK